VEGQRVAWMVKGNLGYRLETGTSLRSVGQAGSGLLCPSGLIGPPNASQGLDYPWAVLNPSSFVRTCKLDCKFWPKL
jgi:hypothetical protein